MTSSPDPTLRDDDAAVPGVRRSIVRDWLVLAIGVFILALLRMHAFDAPFEVDECNYAYFGRQLVAGDDLYVRLWDHQPPGMFMLTATLTALFGSDPMVFRVAATVVAILTLLIIHAVCRSRVSTPAAHLAVLLFALVSSDPGVAGDGWNREVFMNLCGAAGLWCVLMRRGWSVLVGGLCLGLSSLLKTVAAAQWVGLAVALVAWSSANSCPPSASRWRPRAAAGWLLCFAAGPALVWIVTLAYFSLTDRLESLIDAAFIYNLDYGRVDIPLWRKIIALIDRWAVFRSALPLWLAGGVGVLAGPWRRNPRLAGMLAGYGLGSLLAVSLPGWRWNHYYMLMLPSLVIGAAVVFDRLSAEKRGSMQADGARPVGWLANGYGMTVLVLTLVLQFLFYLALDPDEVTAVRYGGRMAWAREQGRVLRRVTEPEDAVYVCGIDTGIYYYGQRRCATRYTLATALAGDDAAARGRRNAFLEDLCVSRPRLIFIIQGGPYIPELDRYIHDAGYVLIAREPNRVDVLADPARPVVWE